ncbi:hypothetical protein [Celeribacter neptunius]|uniref:Uncharacterized protein n=1 Tax=Celeribacter neptunius TaxID=588602 RepID=A0A1I3JW23_9RHOB|nr:hypothetical protein [Celeribacter neptunius]SFI64280.1 hypothetical protein SAMN04487991_0481 [Celeribacter neptunius]
MARQSPPEHDAQRVRTSTFARFIDGLFWFRIGGLVALLLVLITNDPLRHAVMRMLFSR